MTRLMNRRLGSDDVILSLLAQQPDGWSGEHSLRTHQPVETEEDQHARHHIRSLFIGWLHADDDQRNAPDDTDDSQRAEPHAEVPGAQRLPCAPQCYNPQSCRDHVGDVKKDNADRSDRRIDRREDRKGDLNDSYQPDGQGGRPKAGRDLADR